MKKWDINCADDSYEDGFYDGEEDVFYCKECGRKHGLKR